MPEWVRKPGKLGGLDLIDINQRGDYRALVFKMEVRCFFSSFQLRVNMIFLRSFYFLFFFVGSAKLA